MMSPGLTSLRQRPWLAWIQWYSETLGVLFLSMGKPVEEIVEYKGDLAEKAGPPMSIGFNVGAAEFSIVRLKLNEGEKLSPKEVLELRFAVPKSKASDFRVKEEKDQLDSDFPFARSWAEYAGPDGAPVSRKILVVGHCADIWIIEVAGLGTLEAREAGNRFLDSIRMDASGTIRPGDKKR